MGSMRIESVSVPVSDQEQAKSLYLEPLGFEPLVDDTWREGMRWSEVAPRSHNLADAGDLVGEYAPGHVPGHRHVRRLDAGGLPRVVLQGH